ncbi:MAG: FxSxx-COOH protein [Actinomycetota bacterium]|nr:FxSxx-COOH protein [Actinomycetota bacterium]
MTDPLLDHETDLVDLTDLPLSQVMTMEESVLAQSLRRLAQDVDQQEDIVAGFQSFLM